MRGWVAPILAELVEGLLPANPVVEVVEDTEDLPELDNGSGLLGVALIEARGAREGREDPAPPDVRWEDVVERTLLGRVRTLLGRDAGLNCFVGEEDIGVGRGGGSCSVV